jgi:hypothetical protein
MDLLVATCSNEHKNALEQLHQQEDDKGKDEEEEHDDADDSQDEFQLVGEPENNLDQYLRGKELEEIIMEEA